MLIKLLATLLPSVLYTPSTQLTLNTKIKQHTVIFVAQQINISPLHIKLALKLLIMCFYIFALLTTASRFSKLASNKQHTVINNWCELSVTTQSLIRALRSMVLLHLTDYSKLSAST